MTPSAAYASQDAELSDQPPCANQVLDECLFLEPQPDSATKPRAATNELPWVWDWRTFKI
jgi:hypothetical protein